MNPPKPDITNPMHRFDDQARLVFHLAREEAVRLGHPRIAAEHLLLGVLRLENNVTQVLNQMGLSLKHARNRLEEIVGRRENLNADTIADFTETAKLSMEDVYKPNKLGLGMCCLGLFVKPK
jgi:ATP-dependent Clp protease ATP-binding subunit ClpC